MGIEDVEAAGDYEVITHGPLHGLDRVKEKSASVLEGSAVAPLPCMGCKELAHQVAMAGLDVYAVEAGLLCKHCTYYIALRKAVQILVGDDDLIALVQHRIMLRYNWTSPVALRSAVAARVCQLEDFHRLEAMLLHAQVVDLLHQVLELLDVGCSEHHLKLVGPSLRDYCIGLEPDKSETAFGVLQVSVIYKLGWGSVSVRVTAFHWKNGESVGGCEATDLHRASQNLEVLFIAEAKTKFPGPVPYLIKTLEIEFLMGAHVHTFLSLNSKPRSDNPKV